MTATSFKQLYQSGDIKKKDIFRMPYRLLKVQPGFNPRDLNKPETQAKIQGMKESIKAGAFIPPLLVRIVDGFGVITDGECRYTAYGLAIAEGAEIEMIDVQPDTGNDADRVATAITSSQGEALTPLETSLAYKRLIAYGWEPQQVASRVGKTRQHVDQLLILANANSDVHALVRSGAVSASIAIDAVRKHGEKAGEFLAKKHGEAKAVGKSRVTASTVKGKNLPRAVVSNVIERVDSLIDSLNAEARKVLWEVESKAAEPDTLVSIPAGELLALLEAHNGIGEAREKQQRKTREGAAKAAQMDIEDAA